EPSVQKAIRKTASKYCGDEYVTDVLDACGFYLREQQSVDLYKNHISGLRKKNPSRNKLPGRPKDSKDWAEKELIHKLAIIFKKAKGELPKTYDGRFGFFVQEIACAILEIDEKYNSPWRWHINDVLKGSKFKRLRRLPFLLKFVDFKFAVTANKDEIKKRIISRNAAVLYGAHLALRNIGLEQEKEKIEARIKEPLSAEEIFNVGEKEYEENDTKTDT
ncbi:hypothetical protein ACFL5J_01465, partial [Thermodesulfobacteriota bacterium]